MSSEGFRPAVPPSGRLVRLGIVLDQRNDARQTMRVAQMAERAGLQSLWVSDRLITADGRPRMEAWTTLTVAGFYTKQIRLGGMFSAGLRRPQSLGAMAASLDAVLEGRMELGVAVGWDPVEFAALGLAFDDEDTRIEAAAKFAEQLMLMVTGRAAEGDRGIGVSSPQPGGPPLTMELSDPRQLPAALRMADNVMLADRPLVELAGVIGSVRNQCERFGRHPDSLGIAVELPVSVGRTDAESDARVEIDDLLSQMDTRSMGIHGTLERCQDTMIELAHMGVSDVRCILPNVADIDDVIAQLSATAVGTKEVLKPGMERSLAPAPPPGWGGLPKKGTA